METLINILGGSGWIVALIGNGGIITLIAWLFVQQRKPMEQMVQLNELTRADNVELRAEVEKLKIGQDKDHRTIQTLRKRVRELEDQVAILKQEKRELIKGARK